MYIFLPPRPPVTVWLTGSGAGWGQLVQEVISIIRPLNSDYTPCFLLITNLCLLHFNRLEPRLVWWCSFTLLVLLIKYSGEKKKTTTTQQHRHIVLDDAGASPGVLCKWRELHVTPPRWFSLSDELTALPARDTFFEELMQFFPLISQTYSGLLEFIYFSWQPPCDLIIMYMNYTVLQELLCYFVK